MDTIPPARRSANMRAIKAKNTKPEMVVRKELRALGETGYRLHRKDLPGRPDIAFIGRKKAILVHGCFWHGHDCKAGVRRPKSRQDYWLPKIAGNQARDMQHQQALAYRGWDVLVLWDCEIKKPGLPAILAAFLQTET